MSDKFLNGAGLGAIRTWVLNKLGLKQDTLVSGTNIKTINNVSILGSGNIDISSGGSGVFVATYGVTPVSDVLSAYEQKKEIILSISDMNLRVLQARGYKDGWDGGGIVAIGAENSEELSDTYRYHIGFTFDTSTYTQDWGGVYTERIATSYDLPTDATDTVAGLVKLNPLESVTLNSNGQLNVGGRLGQFGAAGIFHAKDRDPRNVGEYSLLITDAMGMDMQSSRSFAVTSGIGISGVISGRHPAGCTEYYIRNTYANRLMCAGLTYVSKDEATSKVQRIVAVESITIKGNALTPDSSADDSANPIIIKTAESLNPDSALTATSIRGFRSMIGYASAYIGSAVGSETGGAQLILGQGCFSKSGNMNVILGQYHYNQGNGNTLLGRQHISKKSRWLLAGTGHDNTNGQSEAGAAVGQYSDIDANTLFAVGNGTSATVRSNAFEVLDDGIVLKSPNGTRYKITVSDTGEVTTTAL